jgi:hypothetical protein
MSYNVQTTPNFDREAKRLKRKYPSLKSELSGLIDDLEQNPFLGTDLGNGVRKIRLAIQSKGKGKRGGARIMTCIKLQQESLFLFSIFDKGEQETILDNTIKKLIENI